MHIKMKGGSWNSLRGKQFLLTIFALVCTSIFLWAWEKTTFVSTLLPQQDQFKVLSPVSLKHKLDVEVDSPDAVEVQEETTNQRGPDFDKQKTGVQEHFSDAAEGRESKNRQPEHISDDDKKGEEEVSSLPAEPRDTRTVEPSQGVGGAEIDSMNVSTSEKRKGDEDLTKSPMEKKGCNYAKGKWVPDSKRPLYSGFGCKQWLSEMWACRLTQRPDFSFEGFRWQPQDCEMPEFEGYSFLRKMQDKTLAFIGDSLGRQQFQSLMCMITGGKEYKEVEDVGRDYGLVKARGAVRPDGWAYRFPRTNTTILYYWSASLCKLEPLNITNPLTEYAMHLDQPVTFLSKYLHNFDVLVLNTGHHWNRGKISANRWVMHVNGQPNKDRAISQIGNAKNLTIYSVVKWLDSQLPNHPRLKAFFRTISPRHFVNGDWNSGGSCDNPVPLAGGSEVSQEESSDLLVSGAVKGTRAKLLDITALSQLRDECHISKYSVKGTQGAQDCLHWCLPGVPDTWNEILSAQI